MPDVPTPVGETGRAESVPEAAVLEAARTFWADLQPPFNPDHWVRDEEFGAACQFVWSSALASQADVLSDLRDKLIEERAISRRQEAEIELANAECASQAVEIERLRAELDRANFAREKLGQTIAACPEGHHDANLAHARAERDQLRAEAGQMRGQLGAAFALNVTYPMRIRARDAEIERLRAELAEAKANSDARAWRARNLSYDRCRWCRVTIGQPHRMTCRFYEGPVTHDWVRIIPNLSMGGDDYLCTCGSSTRQHSGEPDPVCPKADETERHPSEPTHFTRPGAAFPQVADSEETP